MVIRVKLRHKTYSRDCFERSDATCIGEVRQNFKQIHSILVHLYSRARILGLQMSYRPYNDRSEWT